jgi:hypothetical protein
MLRDRVFAHNDNTGHRLPTIGFNDRIEPATANLNLGGLVFVTSRIPAVRDLVTAQRARLEARGDVLLAELVELYPFDRWLTDIDAIPD